MCHAHALTSRPVDYGCGDFRLFFFISLLIFSVPLSPSKVKTKAWAAKRAIASLITLTQLSSKRVFSPSLSLCVCVCMCKSLPTKYIGGGPFRRSKRETITAPQCGSNQQTIKSVHSLKEQERARERMRGAQRARQRQRAQETPRRSGTQ